MNTQTENIVMVELHPSKTSKHIQLVVKKCPFCKNRHNHGIGEGWRVTDCFNKKTGKRLSTRQYYLQIDWKVPKHAKLKSRYYELLNVGGDSNG
ncbi:hypothetical protein [Sporosarcina jiandibaonis]|uniref:hypothetical protein n=1 Tax=Sporosarcina jiandibaonis TaxID=2715535 RepID=UPI001553BDF8|nr:hypothetical protein [Sporosarcina jiandibaonis]